MGLFKGMKDLASLSRQAKELQADQQRQAGLAKLRDSGALTDAEFEQQKARILGS